MERPHVLDLLKRRGLIDQISSESLYEVMKNPITVYAGFDPTAPSLHLGNLQAIMLLAWFERCGHRVVALLGGATGMIGDPSGKSAERQLLSEETLSANMAGIERDLRQILTGDGLTFVNNYDWFKEFSFIRFLRDVGKYFRMGVMLSKESVKLRLASEEGLSFTEFSYQLLQGYDYLYLFEKEKALLQVGGSDQWGNITAGIELIRKAKGAEVYGLTMPLLVKADGTKFGKSESGAVWLSEDLLSSFDFYQHLLRVRDDEVVTLLKRLTFIDIEEIELLEKKLAEGTLPPSSLQALLAREVTRLVRGEEALEKALRVTSWAKPGHKTELSEEFFLAFRKEVSPFVLPKEQVVGVKVIDLLTALGLVVSKGEARRLIRNGGVAINEVKLNAEQEEKSIEGLFQDRWLLINLGKKNKILVEVA